MKKNNYDQSSIGINIESYCHYDNWLSQQYFNENFEEIKGFSTKYGGRDSAWFYTDSGQLSDDSLSEFKTSGKIKDYEKLCDYNFISIERANYDNASDYKIDVMRELVALEGFRSAVNEANTFDIKLDFKNDIRIIEIRGYSQGEYAEVYADFTQLESIWGKIPSESELSELFTHYFYDSPIACQVTINYQEYNIYDMPGFTSEYEFQRDEFIQWVKTESGHDISEFIPDSPDYNY